MDHDDEETFYDADSDPNTQMDDDDDEMPSLTGTDTTPPVTPRGNVDNPELPNIEGAREEENPRSAEITLEIKGDYHTEVKRLRSQSRPESHCESHRRSRRRERLRLLWGWLAILSFVLSLCFLSVSTKGFEKLKDTFNANNVVTYLIICLFYISVIALVIWTSRNTKFWQIQALVKFVITSLLPGLSLVAGSISKNDIWFFLFLMFTATCITFVLLACETPEDYGITDMLVAIGMGFCLGPDGMGIWWKMIFGALPASSKAIIPIIFRYIHKNAKVEQGSIATDLEPTLREKKWKVTSVTSEEAKEYLETLRAMYESVEKFDPRIQELMDDARRQRSIILQEINNFRSRLENVR